MNMRYRFLLIIVGLLAVVMFFYWRWPIVTGKLNGQTIYLAFLNSFHAKDSYASPRFMLIDDDSGEGIYKIREICERVGLKATFAVVPAFLDSARCDSLRRWQLEGYGIALHSYDHGRWKDWSEEEVKADIDKSIDFLKEKGFDVSKINIVVSPSFYNTSAIRSAISSKGMKMVMGANIVNPDTTVFQWGRLFVKKDTDVGIVHKKLEIAKASKGFIVFGTHSSIDEEFSIEKTESILQITRDLGFINICSIIGVTKNK